MHHATSEHREIDWVNTTFIALAHVGALAALIYSLMVGTKWENIVLAVVWFFCAGLSITGGYHRLFSHKTYRAAWPLRLFYVLFGAAGVQNSVVNWSSDHRRHHAVTDEDEDPYNSLKGFWWSHVGWVLFKDPLRDVENVGDLVTVLDAAGRRIYSSPSHRSLFRPEDIRTGSADLAAHELRHAGGPRADRGRGTSAAR